MVCVKLQQLGLLRRADRDRPTERSQFPLLSPDRLSMAYTNWKTTRKSVGALFLDPSNSRIPPTPTPLSEQNLITELVLHDDVYQLASNIQANGFFPTEPLVAVRENGKLYVVEGNRRLAACKLLVNPDLAPDHFKAKFRGLSVNTEPASFKSIPVTIAPNRDSTTPIIIARHTSPQIQRWSPAMQARFYKNLASRGLSIDEIATTYNVPVKEVRASLQSYNLYQMACRLELSPDTSRVVGNPREFKLTNLTRVFESSAGRKFFGVEWAEDGKLLGTVPEVEFKKGFERLVQDVATGVADSRKWNTAADIKQNLEAFSPSEQPDLSKDGSFDSDSFLSTAAPQPIVRPSAKKQKRKQLKASRGLVPRDFDSKAKNARIKDLLRELKSLHPNTFPNAVALAFRCFLDLSTSCFLQAKGEIRKMIVEEKERRKQENKRRAKVGKPAIPMPPDWSPNLSVMIRRILDKGFLTDPQLVKAMRMTLSDEKKLIELNLYAHNPHYHPTEPALRKSWRRFEQFLRFLNE